MISNLTLLFYAIAKVLLICGLGPAITFAALYEKRAFKFRGRQLAIDTQSCADREEPTRFSPAQSWATSLPRKKWREA